MLGTTIGVSSGVSTLFGFLEIQNVLTLILEIYTLVGVLTKLCILPLLGAEPFLGVGIKQTVSAQVGVLTIVLLS